MPFPDFSRPFSLFWRRQRRSRVRPFVYFLATASMTWFCPRDLGTRRRGSTVVLDKNEVSFVPVPYGNAQPGVKDLSEFAPPRQPWLAGDGPLCLQPPETLACRDWSAGSFSFFQIAQQKCPCTLRTKKDGKEQRDAHSTSMLGVSRH